MKIQLDIPKWVDPKQTLMLLSGKELVWFKHYHQPGKMKIVRCNQCGECCMDFPPVIFGSDDEGKCTMLEKDGDKWVCRAGADTPKRCLSDPVDREGLGCCIEYDE